MEEIFSDRVEEGDGFPQVTSSFQPSFLFSDRVEPLRTARRLTVAILFPSGVTTAQFSIRVSEDGNSILLTVTWPERLMDLEHLHRRSLKSESSDRIEMDHAKMIGFGHFLRSYRTRKIDGVESTTKIFLPLQLQSHLSKKHH